MANIKVNGTVKTLELLYNGHDELFDILAAEDEYDYEDADDAFVMDEAQYERIDLWVRRERKVIEVVENDPSKRVIIDDLMDGTPQTLEEIQALEYEALGLEDIRQRVPSGTAPSRSQRGEKET